MAGTYIPAVPSQYLKDDGTPAASYQLFTYAAGTSTKLATYSDVDLSVANANPIVLDSSGRATIFLSIAAYKFVLATDTDTDPPASPVWTRDNISATPVLTVDLDVTGTAGETLAAGEFVYLSAGDGSRTAGSWYKTDSDLNYASSTANAIGFAPSAIASAATGSIRLSGRLTGLTGLTAGTLYYVGATAGAIVSSAPVLVRALGVADTTTSLVFGQWFIPGTWQDGAPDASATVIGDVNLSAQTLGDGLKHLKQRPTFNPGVSDATDTAKASGVIDVNVTAVGNVGGGEDDLMSHTLTANVLDANGSALRVSGHFTTAGGGTKTVKFHFGGTAVTLYAATGAVELVARIHIYRTGAGAQLLDGFASSGSGVSAVPTATPAEDETGTIVIKFTGQDDGSVDNQAIQKSMIVEVLN